MWLLIFQRLAFDFFLDILYFPVWWYTAGFMRLAKRLAYAVEDMNTSLAPGLWLKFMFVPMFGQRDFQGRIMSLFMRIVNIIGRGVALAVYVAAVLCLLTIWVVFPVFVMYMMAQAFYGI